MSAWYKSFGLASVLAVLSSSSAFCQDAAPLETTDAGSIFTIAPSEADSYIDVGAAVLTRPAYLGSNDQRTNIFPYLAAEYKGRLFLDPARGAGVYVVHKPKLQVTAFATIAGGRDADETGAFNDLVSIGSYETDAALDAAEDALEIKTSVLASASARYRFKYGLVEVTGAVPVTGDVEGFRTEISLASKIPYEPLGIAVYPGVRATYTSSDWNQVYYGINATQTAATGLDPFEADSDISVIGAFAFVRWDALSQSLGDDIQVIALANYNWLQGDLKDSPLTPDDHGLTAVLGVAKRF